MSAIMFIGHHKSFWLHQHLTFQLKIFCWEISRMVLFSVTATDWSNESADPKGKESYNWNETLSVLCLAGKIGSVTEKLMIAKSHWLTFIAYNLLGLGFLCSFTILLVSRILDRSGLLSELFVDLL